MFKGQAFDTFQLMIAAVIAVAILGILLGIIGSINGNVTQKPVQVVKTLINNGLESPCAPMPSDTVNFKKNDGWVESTFEISSGSRASNVTTDCSNIDASLFTCGESSPGVPDGAKMSQAMVDFQGKMTVMCRGEKCSITVYTATKESPSLENITTWSGCGSTP